MNWSKSVTSITARSEQSELAMDPAHLSLTPLRHIFCDEDLQYFINKSVGYRSICNFIESICESVTNAARQGRLSIIRPSVEVNSICDRFVSAVLVPLEDMLAEFPPLPQSQRFGNKAFSQWHSAATARMSSWIGTYITSLSVDSIVCANVCAVEVCSYLLGSFGDPKRIDYGTGHELSFLCALMCLFQNSEIPVSIVDVIFSRYWSLIKSLLNAYKLEPAGSHGVWGLDDYFHLIFLFGAAEQLGKSDEPVSALFSRICSSLDSPQSQVDSSLFGTALTWSVKAKPGAPINETSPVLWSLAGVKDWNKVTLGLMRMYKGEVLGKLPVVQHLLFGYRIQW